MEKDFKKDIEVQETKANILYLQILNNRAFTNYNLSLFEESIQDCDNTLRIDSKNLKGLYRRALSFFEKSKLINEGKNALQEREKLLEQAKENLEKIMVLNKDNQSAKEKLEEIVKEIVKIRMKIKETQPPPSKTNENKKEQKNENIQEKNLGSSIKKESNLNEEFLNNVTFNVSKKVMDDLIDSKDLPATANVFEKDCLAFKTDLSKLFLYIKKIPLEHFVKLFLKKEIPSETLLLILQSIKIFGITYFLSLK